MTSQEFAAKIRAKYPGVYDKLDDATLVGKIVDKYPQYKAQIADSSPLDAAVANLGDKMGFSSAGGPMNRGTTNDAMANYWKDKGDYPDAGAEKPVEQKLAENTVNVGNAAGMGFGGAALIDGLGGLALKGAGAISRGMAPTMEGLGDTVGSMIPTGWKGLPENALQAKTMVDDAARYAMNPHPEVQQAIMDISGGAPKAAAEAGEDIASGGGSDLVPAGESTVKTPAASGTPELPSGESTAMTNAEPEGPVLEGEVTNPPSHASSGDRHAENEVPNEMGLFDKPIFSMDHMTPASQLQHTEAQMDTIGQAIGDQLKKLEGTGKLYDVGATGQQLDNMFIRNASGEVIPPGDGSEQAINNAMVKHAKETLYAEATDSAGNIQPLSWERANAAKTALQRLAQETGSPATAQAARLVRDSIDDQAEKIMAANGENIAPFQQLRDAYGKLAQIHTTLNSQVRSALGAKNSVPVIRSGAALAGVATGNPGLAAAAGTDFFGRKYGTLALARGLHNLGNMGEIGANAAPGAALSSAGRGIAAGLASPDDEDR